MKDYSAGSLHLLQMESHEYDDSHPMNIFIEGSHWAGETTKITEDVLRSLGHRTGVYYHNERSFHTRVFNRLYRLVGTMGVTAAGESYYTALSNKRLRQEMSHGHWDMLFSIQGKIDPVTISFLRRNNPALRVIYWWCDIMTVKGTAKLKLLKECVDVILVAYGGDYERLKSQGMTNIYYFPFGMSSRFHLNVMPSRKDIQRYASDVSFVGTCYPERCDVIRALNTKLENPVHVWGRSWRRCKGIGSKRNLSLAESLKVHACSKISLNIHHHQTNNGVNMKFFEIPAAGGFEIVNWQPILQDSRMNRGITTFRNLNELVDKIHYFLAREDERKAIARHTKQLMLQHDRYENKFQKLLHWMTQERGLNLRDPRMQVLNKL